MEESGSVLGPSSADASVRPARPADADAIGAVHARAWRTAYRDVLPEAVLTSLRQDSLADAWRQAVTDPPSRRHQLLVACSGTTTVGFAAVAPSGDQDAEEGVDGEIVALAVDPVHQRAGHASRLLSASVAALREEGFARIATWCPLADGPRAAFFTSAGMVLDGARRELDTPGEGSPHGWTEVRLAAAIGDPPDAAQGA